MKWGRVVAKDKECKRLATVSHFTIVTVFVQQMMQSLSRHMHVQCLLLTDISDVVHIIHMTSFYSDMIIYYNERVRWGGGEVGI